MLIVGGGTGGCAAALALVGKGLTVVLTEETDWLGGQLTSQMVPPDEHPWIESFGRTRRYQAVREQVRKTFWNEQRQALLAAGETALVNPGGGWVSRLCAEPALFLKVLRDFLEAANGLILRLRHRAVETSQANGQILGVALQNLDTGTVEWIEPRFVLDATELGDLLPMTGTEYVVGAESRQDTGEPHAVEGPAQPDNVQAFTWCAAVGWDPDGDHTIQRPDGYDFWRQYVPPDWTGTLLSLTFPNVRTGEPMTLPLFSPNSPGQDPRGAGGEPTLFGYRQIVDPANRVPPAEAVTVMNWPQNDYALGHVIDIDEESRNRHFQAARNLTLSVLYWLQTEMGYKGLRLRPDIAGTDDGLAKAPYHREGRRIKALHTIREQDVSPECNPGRSTAPPVKDSVGVGAYRIDLHPSANGAKTIDIGCLPFQIPLGALVPRETTNLLPACKNIGTTHITNGCYRLHPVEWNIGESSGLLAWFCLARGLSPQEVALDPRLVTEYQQSLIRAGVELSWPEIGPL